VPALVVPSRFVPSRFVPSFRALSCEDAHMSLSARFRAHLEESGLVKDSPCLVVATSGGGDSTALLLLLHDWAKETPHAPVLVPSHVAHGLRGISGDRDALAASNFAASLGLAFALRPVEVAELRLRGESLEAAARRLRYQALKDLARELGPGTRVATGHTLDDQAETVLLNLHCHSGRSRGGIRAHRADGVVRPLLTFTRAELRQFLSRRSIPWREDETNENEAFERNRIRRQVLPELEGRSPGTAARLVRAAEAWNRRLDALDTQIDAALEKAETNLAGPFPRVLFSSLSEEAALRLLVRAAGVTGAIPGGAQLRKVLRRLRTESRVEESLAGFKLKADTRAVRLLPLSREALAPL
jgi:tRNA(Ile)-lysidine synthetase-like protein